MGVLRVERARAHRDSRPASAGVAWRDFDLQLFVYAVLLATLGLDDGVQQHAPRRPPAIPALQSGTTFARGLVWAIVALVAFAGATAFDYTGCGR